MSIPYGSQSKRPNIGIFGYFKDKSLKNCLVDTQGYPFPVMATKFPTDRLITELQSTMLLKTDSFSINKTKQTFFK